MELILYTNVCLTCRESDRLGKIKRFARENDIQFRLKSAYVVSEFREEANKIGAKMPFIYFNDKTVDFYSISSDLRVDDVAELLQYK